MHGYIGAEKHRCLVPAICSLWVHAGVCGRSDAFGFGNAQIVSKAILVL